MQDSTFEQIGDGGQPDMRVRPHVHATTRWEIGGGHVVEENERPDGFAMGDRQHAADAESSKVALPTFDDIDYGVQSRITMVYIFMPTGTRGFNRR